LNGKRIGIQQLREQTSSTHQQTKGKQMSVLSSLKLVAAKRPQAMPAIQVRRNKLSNKLYEQIKLATALNEGKTYNPLRLRTFRNKETGEIKTI